MNMERELLKLLLANGPNCDEVQTVSRDPNRINHVEDPLRMGILYHLRKCDHCREVLSAQEYMNAIQLLVMID